MHLRSLDVLVLVKLTLSREKNWTYATVASELTTSASQIFRALKRSGQARLYDPIGKKPIRHALEEFLIHGVKYAFPAEVGTVTRGIPTSFSAPVLEHNLAKSNEIYVWPHSLGEVRGFSVTPLFKTVPNAVPNDLQFYKALALIDAVRIGRKREQSLAVQQLKDLLHGPNA